jgi:hypothetical protein
MKNELRSIVPRQTFPEHIGEYLELDDCFDFCSCVQKSTDNKQEFADDKKCHQHESCIMTIGAWGSARGK